MNYKSDIFGGLSIKGSAATFTMAGYDESNKQYRIFVNAVAAKETFFVDGTIKSDKIETGIVKATSIVLPASSIIINNEIVSTAGSICFINANKNHSQYTLELEAVADGDIVEIVIIYLDAIIYLIPRENVKIRAADGGIADKIKFTNTGQSINMVFYNNMYYIRNSGAQLI